MDNRCRFVFKSVECGYTGACNYCDKTVQSCKALNNFERFEGYYIDRKEDRSMTIEQIESKIKEMLSEYGKQHGRMINSVYVDWHEAMGMEPMIIRLRTESITCSTYRGCDDD